MVFLVETDLTFEALASYCKAILKQINNGEKITKEDLELADRSADEVLRVNKIVHKMVVDKENKRYGTINGTCLLLKDKIKETLSKKEENTVPDFDSMTKDELVNYIRTNIYHQESPDDLVLTLGKQEPEPQS